MICETCAHSGRPGYVITGTVPGWLAIAGHRVPAWGICPDCGGSTVSHCCEGLVATPDCEQEEWRLISAWPNYEVSSFGRVRRATPAYWDKAKKRLRVPAGYILSPRVNSSGYLSVLFPAGEPKERRFKNRLVSRLVCEAFHGAPPTAKHEAAHWDRDVFNCRADNLRWATPAENQDDKKRHGTTARGVKNHGAKLTPEKVIAIKLAMKRGVKPVLLSKQYDVAVTTIYAIRYNQNWSWLSVPPEDVDRAAEAGDEN